MRRILIAAILALCAMPTFAQTPATHAPAARTATTPAPARTAAAPKKIDINSATAAQLDALPGIGPVRAKKIVEGRPYADLNDLVTKKVLTQGVFDKAMPGMALANINTSSARDLEKTLPGIGDVRAKAIVAARPYSAPQDLVTKGVLTENLFAKIKDVVAY